jgi:hypothetical protein
MELYTVKMTGARDAMAKFAGVDPDLLQKLKGAASWAFSAHPLPTYAKRVRQTPGFAENLYRRAVGKPVFRGPAVFAREQAAGHGTGLVNRLRTVGHAVGDFARESVLGSPVTVANELREHGPGQFYKNFFMPGGSRGAAAFQALTMAPDFYDAATAPEGHKGEAIGRAVGGAAMLPLTSRLGIPGQLLLHAPVTNLAGRIGRAFDSPSPSAPPPANPHPILSSNTEEPST